MDGEPIRQWIPGLLKKQSAAVEAVVGYLRPAMLGLARGLLRGARPLEADEEDVVNAALHSFLRRAADNQFPQLRDEDDLWRVVRTIVTRKALNQRRRERRRLDRDRIDGDRAPAPVGSDPASIALQNDLFRRLLERLQDPELRRIAELKLEAWTNLEIAVELQRSVSTIERRLRLIRSCWLAVLAEEDEELDDGH